MEWMILPYKRYADFSGRSQRMEYWMFNLFFYLVLIVLVFVGIPLSDMTAPTYGEGPGLVGGLFIILAGLFVLGSIIPHIAVTVRRFHDQDKSGWMYLLSFIPYVGGLVVFVFMCIEGTYGENSYGPDPKRHETNADVFS